MRSKMKVFVCCVGFCLILVTATIKNDSHKHIVTFRNYSDRNHIVSWTHPYHDKKKMINMNLKRVKLHKRWKKKNRPRKPKVNKKRHKKAKKTYRRKDKQKNKVLFNQLKRPFQINDMSQTNLDHYPVATFGNFTSNNIYSEGKYVENRRKAAIYGAHNRWKHLDPHLLKVKNLIVRIHNVFRSTVSPSASNMLAMTWDKMAAEHAQKWAEQCKPTSGRDHQSSRWTTAFGTCGQNVHVAFKKKRWRRVARYWWNDKKHFRFGRKNNASLVQQYTQMVWHNSHKVGCGFAECASRNGKSFFRYVCNYCPAGNDPTMIDKPYKIGPRCASCPNSCRTVCPHGEFCKLCTNSCPFSDLWANCKELAVHWKDWLCNTKTAEGVSRFKKCRATCQCSDKLA